MKAKPASAETVFEAETQTVVVRCGAEERVFQFPWEQSVDRTKLRRVAPEVDALWGTYARLRERFGPNFHFDFTSTRRTSPATFDCG